MRVLIISPHFPPTNAADHQRVRLLVPYLRGYGWQAEVLAVDSADVAAPLDEWLADGLPPEVAVCRVRALGLAWSRIPGLGTITFRALGALRRMGDRLLKTGRFDLVFFSTTQFGVHVLGPRWKRKFGIPFVMDYQDPWVDDYYRKHAGTVPPGGLLKFGLAHWLNRRQEPQVLRHCAGITTVSPDYACQLGERYPWLKVVSEEQGADGRNWEMRGKSHGLPFKVLPFPGDVTDLQRVTEDGTRQNVFSPGDGLRHWVYAGRGGADMGLALRGIFGAIQTHAQSRPDFLKKLRLHFIGTSYAAAGKGQKTVEPLAAGFGLAHVVREHPSRLPYSQTMRCLLDANALIVPGSDDPAYTASKIYPYLLAEKPLLAVFHEKSSVVSLMKKVHGGVCVSFRSNEQPEQIATRVSRCWLLADQFERPVVLDQVAFAPHTAREQARVLAEFFALCVMPRPGANR